MERTIYEEGTPIGTLQAQEDGLFWKFDVKIENRPEQIRRVFVISGWSSQYLGIPDAAGVLTARLARRHLPEGVSGAVATVWPRCPWLPWRGEVDGVFVDACWLRPREGGMDLAMLPQTAIQFPAWAPWLRTEPLFDTQMAVFELDQNGRLPLIEKEGGTTNETFETMDGDAPEPLLSAEPAADDDAGGGDPEEADRTDPG